MKPALCRIVLAAVTAWLCLPHPALRAQPFPAKPIRIIVPYPPGGGVDIMARLVASKLPEKIGQQVIVDNRPGAGGVIGVEAVVRSAPDGYTILFATGGSMSIAPAIGIKAPYDVFKDLAPIVLLRDLGPSGVDDRRRGRQGAEGAGREAGPPRG